MNKSNKKAKRVVRDPQNRVVVKRLMDKYKITEAGVYKILRNESDSELADEVRKEHGKLMKKISSVLQQL